MKITSLINQVLDLLEGRPIYTLKGHSDSVTSITFSEEGNYFASGGSDCQIFVWKTNFEKSKNINNNSYTNLQRYFFLFSNLKLQVVMFK